MPAGRAARRWPAFEVRDASGVTPWLLAESRRLGRRARNSASRRVLPRVRPPMVYFRIISLWVLGLKRFLPSFAIAQGLLNSRVCGRTSISGVVCTTVRTMRRSRLWLSCLSSRSESEDVMLRIGVFRRE